MNTRNVYARRRNAAAQKSSRAPIGLAQGRARAPRRVLGTAHAAAGVPHPACDTLPARSCRHPLTDLRANEELARCEERIKGRFDAIVPTLREISTLQHEPDFSQRAQALAQAKLGYGLPAEPLESAWVEGLDMRKLYASCVFRALRASVEEFADNLKGEAEETQDARNFFLDCGFHSVDITPCADGRLKGLSKYILRLPLSALAVRKAYAGALFDVEANILYWQGVELARYRECVPTTPEAGTRYLKVVVYHRSSSDPSHEGCAAHGSNDREAAKAGLERLNEFRQAIENSYCCGASVDILLIGVDTDTDAIQIHIPDAEGELNLHRYVDNAQLYRETLGLSADAARLAVYEAVDRASEADGWAAGNGRPHDGMRRFIVNLLINNLSQIEYVSDLYGGRYPDIGHAERYISVGDGFEEVQLRNLAYYVHLHTVEESAPDLDVGIKIFTKLNLSRGLPIPVAIHYRYDANVPGSRQRMEDKCRRIKAAVLNRYPDLASRGMIVCQMSLQKRSLGSPLEIIDEEML